jgi:5'-3' exonuclease
MTSVLLIDASIYIYRYFHTITTTKGNGVPTGAVVGFVSLLEYIRRNHKKYLYYAIVFDCKKKNFRHMLYPPYKQNRSHEKKESLFNQFHYIFSFTEAMGIPSILIKNHEADDVIFSLSHFFHDCQVDIMTGDKDLYQLLVDERIHIIDRNKRISKKNLLDYFPVSADLVRDYLALVGDQSDNIPGVKSIGPISAKKLLTSYGSIDQILLSLHQINPRLRKAIQYDMESLILSRKLVSLTQVNCDNIIPSDFLLKEIDYESIFSLTNQLEMDETRNRILNKYYPIKKKIDIEVKENLYFLVKGKIFYTFDGETYQEIDLLKEWQNKKLVVIHLKDWLDYREENLIQEIPEIWDLSTLSSLLVSSFIAYHPLELILAITHCSKEKILHKNLFEIYYFFKKKLTQQTLQYYFQIEQPVRIALEKLAQLPIKINSIFLLENIEKISPYAQDSIQIQYLLSSLINMEKKTTIPSSHITNTFLSINLNPLSHLWQNLPYLRAPCSNQNTIKISFPKLDLAILGYFSQDQELLKIYHQNSKMTFPPLLSFYFLYDFDLEVIKENLNYSYQEIEDYFKHFQIQFPQLSKFHQFLKKESSTNNLSGREINFKKYSCYNYFFKRKENKCYYLIQSSIIDKIKESIILIEKEYPYLKLIGVNEQALFYESIDYKLIEEIKEKIAQLFHFPVYILCQLLNKEYNLENT